MRTHALSCEACGGELRTDKAPVICPYCGRENQVLTDQATINIAREEMLELADWAQKRCPELQEEFMTLMTKIAMGERALIPRAMEVHEGFLRLTYAPTLRFAEAFEHLPAQSRMDPEAVEAIIQNSLGELRRSLGEE